MKIDRSVYTKLMVFTSSLLLILIILPLCFPNLGSFSSTKSPVSLPEEIVLSHTSNIRIDPKNFSLSVTELTTIKTTGDNVKYGIGRMLSPLHLLEGKATSPMKFDIKAISRERVDGVGNERVSFPTTLVLTEGGDTLVRMADMNVPLPPGVYTYTLHYLVEGALVEKDGRNHLFWNATGWRGMPIKETSTLVFPPDEKELPNLTAIGYIANSDEKGIFIAKKNIVPATIGKDPAETNRYGEKRTIITYNSPRILQAGEALFIQVSWLSETKPS